MRKLIIPKKDTAQNFVSMFVCYFIDGFTRRPCHDVTHLLLIRLKFTYQIMMRLLGVCARAQPEDIVLCMCMDEWWHNVQDKHVYLCRTKQQYSFVLILKFWQKEKEKKKKETLLFRWSLSASMITFSTDHKHIVNIVNISLHFYIQVLLHTWPLLPLTRKYECIS